MREWKPYPLGKRPNGKVERVHILLAEKALGRPLPPRAEVHHVNEIRTDNSPGNLVICEDIKYHRLLHYRRKAYYATGRADAIFCKFCRTWAFPEDPAITISQGNRVQAYHRACHAQYQKQRRTK